MVEKLRNRITLISIGALVTVLTVMCFTLSVVLRFNMRKSADSTLHFISDNIQLLLIDELPDDDTYYKSEEGETLTDIIGFGTLITEDTVMQSRFFAVLCDKEGNVLNSNVSHISDISKDQAEMMGENVFAENRERGFYQHFRFLRTLNENGTSYIVFLNCDSMMRPVFFAQFMSTTISILITAAMAVVIWLFSKRVANPFLETLEAQKQFITNAGHEIKTPLSIIDANAEVLRLTEGENEWIDSIQNQTKRLSTLVKRLMLLAKAEESALETITFEKFSMSDAVMETASAFSASAKNKYIKLLYDIAPDIVYKGDETSVRQLVEILLDNAVKYCSENGTITVSLKMKLKHVCLEVSNDCDSPDKKSLDKLFERFYRADDSRSRKTGGYGIGLSIAKAIVTKHKGKIYATVPRKNYITFTALL